MSDPDKNQGQEQQVKPTSFDQIVIDIKENIKTCSTDLINTLLDSAQDKLFTWSNEADSNEDQARYFELTNQIRTLKSTIASNYITNVAKYLRPAKDSEDNKDDEMSQDDDELSLVDRDEMESIVLVKGIGERAGAKYSEQLSQLKARFIELAQKTDTVFQEEALIPTNFCQAFDDALADNFDTENKKILFGMFDIDVANKLDDLYDSINKCLVDAGILPKIKLYASKQEPTSEVTTDRSLNDIQEPQSNDNKTEGTDEKNTDGQNISGFAMTAAPGRNYQNKQQMPSHAPATGNTTDSDGTGSATENSEYQHYTAGMPAGKVEKTLSNFIGTPFAPNAEGTSTIDNAEVFPESTTQHFGHQEIIQALSNIQNQAQFNQQDGARLDGEAIKKAVLEAIAKTSGGAVTKRINQIAEKTIDFIELIFDAIVEDEEISDTIKALLLRLQIPIIKASMSDQEFFIYDDHPARLLLDNIADASAGVTGHDDSIYKFLDKIINNILAEYDLSTKIFKTALDDLNAYTEEQDAIARAKEEEEQRQLLRKHARATVLKSLRATTTGKTLPEEVHALILKRWPTLMFNHYLNNGKENDEWTNIVLTLRHIVDSVQPLQSAEHLTKILSSKDNLFATTQKYLNVSSNSIKDVQNVMAVYKETVQRHIDDANFTVEEITEAEEIINNTEPVEELPIEEDVTDRPTIPSNIMPGMWFQIYMGEDKAVRRCKLSVILVEDANLMFVNHKGELVVEKSFDTFNEEITNESTKIIMGHSAFENAFKTVINRLN